MSGAAVPPGAAAVFGTRILLAQRYADWLAGPGVQRGLIGPREAERLWERHLLNCAVLAELVPVGATVLDLGSGAGLPGLVLSIARPDLRVTLLEPRQRRIDFLSEVQADLGLDSVVVLRGRADGVEIRGQTFDVVTARAVSALDQLVTWTFPLLAPEGALLAIKGSSAADELAAARASIHRRGAEPPYIVRVGAGLVEPETTVVVVRAGRAGQRPSRRSR